MLHPFHSSSKILLKQRVIFFATECKRNKCQTQVIISSIHRSMVSYCRPTVVKKEVLLFVERTTNVRLYCRPLNAFPALIRILGYNIYSLRLKNIYVGKACYCEKVLWCSGVILSLHSHAGKHVCYAKYLWRGETSRTIEEQ